MQLRYGLWRPGATAGGARGPRTQGLPCLPRRSVHRLILPIWRPCASYSEDSELIADSEPPRPADARLRQAQRRQRRAARREQLHDQLEESSDEDVDEEEAEGADTGLESSSSSRGPSRIRSRQRRAARRGVPAPIRADGDLGTTGYGQRLANRELEEEEEEEEEEEDGDEGGMYAEQGEEQQQTKGRPDPKGSALMAASADMAKARRMRHAPQGLQDSGPVVLPESNPMFLPALTDEDLAADPPGHRSGYVAVIGKPNAGKSTLINAFVGQKLSIVTFKPQTTRHRVVGIASDTDYQMIIFDTPGIMREQRNRLDERMMAAVISSIKAAEAIIAVVDVAEEDPQEALSMFQPGPDWSGPPMAVLLNKSDLVGEEQLAAVGEWYKANCRAEEVFLGSALTAEDPAVAGIKAWAAAKLPEGPTLYPKEMVSEQPERFFVSEIIREKIFLLYDQEVPYACQVQIAEFKERGGGAKDYVAATILVERESQKGILVGAGGAALKKLGRAARTDIETFLERQVFLELSVQVAPGWRQQMDRLKDFGYFDPLYIS